MLDVEKRKGIISNFQLHASDTGSPEVQVALLSARITFGDFGIGGFTERIILLSRESMPRMAISSRTCVYR